MREFFEIIWKVHPDRRTLHRKCYPGGRNRLYPLFEKYEIGNEFPVPEVIDLGNEVVVSGMRDSTFQAEGWRRIREDER